MQVGFFLLQTVLLAFPCQAPLVRGQNLTWVGLQAYGVYCPPLPGIARCFSKVAPAPAAPHARTPRLCAFSTIADYFIPADLTEMKWSFAGGVVCIP